MYFMPFLDFRIVLWFEIEDLAMAHRFYVRQGPRGMLCPPLTTSGSEQFVIMVSRCWRISWISKAILKQLLHSYWSSTLLVYLGYFDCFSMRQGLDLGVRYSRISFLCLFLTADMIGHPIGHRWPAYTISIYKEATVLKKWYLMFASKISSNNDMNLWAHYSGPCGRPMSDFTRPDIRHTANLYCTTLNC